MESKSCTPDNWPSCRCQPGGVYHGDIFDENCGGGGSLSTTLFVILETSYTLNKRGCKVTVVRLPWRFKRRWISQAYWSGVGPLGVFRAWKYNLVNRMSACRLGSYNVSFCSRKAKYIGAFKRPLPDISFLTFRYNSSDQILETGSIQFAFYCLKPF